MTDTKISDISTTETAMSNVAYMEGERGDGTPVKIPGSMIRGEVVIQRTVTSGSQANVTFSSIPGTYKDLKIRVVGRSNRASNDNDRVVLQFNGDTGTNYRSNYVGDASSSSSPFVGPTSGSNQANGIMGIISAATSPANAPGVCTAIIPEYAGTTWKKVGHFQFEAQGATDAFGGAGGFSWANAAAITSILVKPDNSTFVDGSIVELVGIP